MAKISIPCILMILLVLEASIVYTGDTIALIQDKTRRK